MAGKPFNPFDDEDNMEFVPGGESEDAESPPAPNPLANHATQIKQQPLSRPAKKSNLKIDFSELQEQGTDTRGATRIGSERLGADEFLSGIKRKDFESAVDRAKASQNAPAHVPVQEVRVLRTVRTPLYLLAFGMVVFVGLLVGGFYGYQAYLERQEHERQQAAAASH
jgi:hypothetical protein